MTDFYHDSDTMTVVFSRIRAELQPEFFVFSERPARMSQDYLSEKPVVVVKRLGGTPTGSYQEDIIDAPHLDIDCYTSAGLEEAYRVAQRVARVLKNMQCSPVTGATPVPIANEASLVRAVNITYVMYVD